MSHLNPKADRARIAEIEAQIDELERSIRLLRKEKNTVQCRLNEYKYPVLTLPSEITSEIFVQVLPPYPLCPPVAGCSSPTTLTHVCRKWRAIGLATPQLWRAIRLRGAQSVDTEAPTETERVKIWLHRSGACSLSIQMDHWPDRLRDFYLGLQNECCEAIVLHRERWEHVQLNVFSYHRLFEGPLPLLSSLSLKMMDSESDGGRPARAVAPLDFPRLEVVSLFEFDLPNPLDCLPWSQLTSLTLNDMASNRYIPILQNAYHLVYLTLICCYGHPSVAELIFPRLQTLVLFICDEHFTDTFRTFIAPALRTLQMPDAVLGDKPIDTLSSFIARSGCRLHTLFITEERTQGISKMAFRDAFPTIPNISFNSDYNWYHRVPGDTDDSGDEEDPNDEGSDDVSE